MPRRKLAFLFLILTLIIPVTAFGQSNDDDEITITVAMPQPEALDPLLISRFDQNARDILESLFVGLTRFDARRGEIVPYLAESWTVSDDGLNWTFNLHDDIYWMDGDKVVRPVSAGDVVFAVHRACDPRRTMPLTANLAIVEGCQTMMNRQDTWNITEEMLNDQIGVTATDETTVEFRLLFPASYFLSLTALPEYRPLPADNMLSDEPYPQATTLLTSGPWIVEKWDGQHMLLISNPDWPLDREGNATRIDIRFDMPANTIANRITSGTLDAARIDKATAESISTSNPDIIETTADEPLWMIGFSLEYEQAANPLLRRALALSIDREQLATALTMSNENVYAPMGRFTPRSALASPSVPGAVLNRIRAGELMDEAGYSQCAGIPTGFAVAVPNDSLSIAVGQNVVDQWHANLGCPVGTFVVTPVSRQLLIDNAHNTLDSAEVSRYPLWLITWTADYPDTNAWLSDALHCQFGVLRTGRPCTSTDRLLQQAGVAEDLIDRINLYTQAETDLFGSDGEFPVIPLVAPVAQWVHQSWIEGVASYGSFQFDRWTVTEH